MSQYTDQPEPIARTKRGRLRIAIGVALLLVAVGVLIVIVVRRNHSENVKQEAVLDVARDEAAKSTNVGDYQTTLKTLQEAESTTQTTQQKMELYAELAAAASSGGDIGKALEYLKLRHELDPKTADIDAYMMGSYYERIEDVGQALEWYERSLAYKKIQDPNDSVGDIASLEAVIRDLRELQ